MKTPPCPNVACLKADRVIRHGFYKTRSGRRRRYRCRGCGRTFSSTAGTPYHRLQHRRSTFDEVAALSVEGVSKSAIATVKRLARNTVDRWIEKAGACSRRFHHERIRELEASEIHADEIRTIVGGKRQPAWIFTTSDVWSRLWPSTVVGRRSYRNTRALLRDVRNRAHRDSFPPIVTDGFEFYEKVVRGVVWPRSIYGQVIKTRRNDRVIRVERRPILGARWRFEEALANSEESSTLHTSFIERLNLTIRQGSAYLCRRSLCHSRWSTRLEEQLELLRCHYNFVRRHRALQFGKEMRTPAMQAGLPKRPLTLRDVFCSRRRFAFRTMCSVTIGWRQSAVGVAA